MVPVQHSRGIDQLGYHLHPIREGSSICADEALHPKDESDVDAEHAQPKGSVLIRMECLLLVSVVAIS
jgi:hypothetical protein